MKKKFLQAIGTSTSIEPYKNAMLPTISLCLTPASPSQVFKTNEANRTLPTVGKADLTKSKNGHLIYFNGGEREK